MIVINDCAPQVDKEHLALLTQCRTETIGHHRHWGFAHGSVKAVIPRSRVVGTAVTVIAPGNDSAIVSHALSMLRPGDVLCIDRLGDHHHSCWGGGTTLAAKLTGAAAVVIDGPSTGSSRFEEFEFPAWITGYTPITCQFFGNGGAINVPISIGGAAVLPGYAVLADESGVVFLPPEDVVYLSKMGIRRQETYPAIHARLRAGEKQADMAGLGTKLLAAAEAEKALRGPIPDKPLRS